MMVKVDAELIGSIPNKEINHNNSKVPVFKVCITMVRILTING